MTPIGQIPDRLLHFARALRAAGMPIGSDRVLDSVDATAAVGLERQDHFYWALHAVLVSRAEHHALFDEAFRLFWREPQALPEALALLLSRSSLPEPERRVSRRLAEAMAGARARPEAPSARRVEIDARLDWSDREVLRTKDFEQMSAEEIREAERAVAAMRLPVRALPTRRLRPDPRGDRVDLRATLRATLRTGRSSIPLRWRSAQPRPPAVVALCDVSGSMARYSRMLLRFLHALTHAQRHVHSFTFGTRLTNVTRTLRHGDADFALAALGRAVRDWEGGTRIGACLREFNLRWARRLLAQGAAVLLLTDGLDREDGRGLAEETERLRRSCRRLIWLNPLLRYQEFEPRAAGIAAMLPHVDDFRPVHDLASLAQLALALGGGEAGARGGGRPQPARPPGRSSGPSRPGALSPG